MACLTGMCFMCLKNNIKLHSVLNKDIDGIVVNIKLRYLIPEIVKFTPDGLKFACSDCIEKLRILYNFKKSVINNNSAFLDYMKKIQYQPTSDQQLQVVLARLFLPLTRDFTENTVVNDSDTNSLQIEKEPLDADDQSAELTSNYNCQTKDINLNTENIEIVQPLIEEVNIKQEISVDEDCSSNYLYEQLKTQDQSCQLTRNENDAFFIKLGCQLEERNVKTEDIEIVDHLLEETNIKQEPIVDEDCSTNYLDEQLKTQDQSCQLTRNKNDAFFIKLGCQLEDKNVKNEDLEIEDQLLEETNIKQEPIVDDDLITIYSDEEEESMESEDLDSTSWHSRYTDVRTNEKSHNCKQCSKAFRYPCELKEHNRVHTGDRPFICQICQKTFTRNDNLTRHMFIHSGQKRFQCDLCKYKCTQVGDLKKHVRTHTGEKPFNCVFCRKSYSYGSVLNRHIKKYHKEDAIFK